MALRNIERENDFSLIIENQGRTRARIFANQQVLIEQVAVDELIQFLEVEETVQRIADADSDFFGGARVDMARVIGTPDFHKGAGVPIGTAVATQGYLIPQAIGKDINCGMRLHLTDYTYDDIQNNLDELENILRYIFFHGGRDIPMTKIQREALFKEGLVGLLSATNKDFNYGLWKRVHELDIEKDLERIHNYGSFEAKTISGLESFLGRDEISRDSQIGSIGGGNHFVEIQAVNKIIDGTIARAWGLKLGHVVVMIHTGSVSIGHLSNLIVNDVVKNVYPRNIIHPKNGIYVLPIIGKHKELVNKVLNSIYNAANFAFANRMFLGLMAYEALCRVCGESSSFPLLYDAPHNLVWEEILNGEKVFVHRKGATPARGFDSMRGTPFEYYGEPVIVPGSMGTSSFILVGQGNQDALSSASHGAGRSVSRQDSRKINDRDFELFLEKFRIVTPIDLKDPKIRNRKDIIKNKIDDLKMEAPFVYKNIFPIIETLQSAGIAKPVVELRPILTVKG